jgi:hypothetical protein
MIRKLTLGQIVSFFTIIGFLISAYLYIKNNETRAEEIRTQYAIDRDRELRQRDSILQQISAQWTQINEIKAAFTAHDAKDAANQKEFDVRMDNVELKQAVSDTKFESFIFWNKKK